MNSSLIGESCSTWRCWGGNPIKPSWEQEKRKRLDKIEEFCAKPEQELYLPNTIESAMLTGMSGLGKSLSVAKILQNFIPQVSVHNTYNNQAFHQKQINWIYLSCPHNASVNLLSSQFLREIDVALRKVGETGDFQSTYMQQHSSSSRIFSGLCEVAMECALGLVVIDELQQLTATKFGGSKLLLNFIVQLQDTLGIPVLMIGNGSADYNIRINIDFAMHGLRLA